MTKESVQDIFAAAVTDQPFRSRFVNPKTRLGIIEAGFLNKKFTLSPQEVEALLTANGKNLSEIAGQVNKKLGYE